MNRPANGPMVRPQDGRVVAGVALALSDRLGISPGAVRLVWFILGFFGGVGVLLYIAGWLLLPEEGAKRSIAEDAIGRLGNSTTWLGVGLIVIAGVTLISMLGWVRADLAWAVALLSVGVLMYQGHLPTYLGPRETETDDLEVEDIESEDAGSGEAIDDGVAADAETESDGGQSGGHGHPHSAEDLVPRRRREKSILGRLTLGTVFVAVGFMAILDTSDLIRPAFTHYMAVAVGVVGIGLLVGSVFGRSRGLIFAGIVLVPIMLASSVVTAAFDGGWGDPVFRPATIGQIDDHYTLTGGDMEIDLRGIDLAGGVVEIEGDLGFGRLLVVLPDGVGLDLTAHVGFGDLIVFGDHNGGVDIDRSVRLSGDGLIQLDLDVGFGALEITSGSVGVGIDIGEATVVEVSP